MSPSCCNVLELRQYTTRPGERETLISIFDRHFVESQEAEGMTVIGQFRDRRRPDRFVWIRGFSDMESRHAALERFYGGPVWAEHRNAANATMLEFHDVLLLKPARPDLAFRLDPNDRPALEENRPAVAVLAGIHSLNQPANPEALSNLERELRASGVHIEGVFVTEPAPNTFTRLPVREGENVLVWFGTLESGEWRSPLADPPTVLLELDPTPRSLWGHTRDYP